MGGRVEQPEGGRPGRPGAKADGVQGWGDGNFVGVAGCGRADSGAGAAIGVFDIGGSQYREIQCLGSGR